MYPKTKAIPSLLRSTTFLFFLTVFFTQQALARNWAEEFTHITKDYPGSFSYEETAKKNYEGITLNILAHVKPNMGEPVALHAKQFEKLTGAKINVHHISFGKLYQEGLWGLKKTKSNGNSIYDIVFYGSLWLPDFVEHVAPIPQYWLDSIEYKMVMPFHKGIAMWNGTPYQPTIDGDRHFFQYRKDVFEEEHFKKSFKQNFGRDLAPPKTWKEANEVAAFFHGRKYKGKELYGTVEITNKDNLMFSHFIKRAAPYAKHPEVKGGFFFDLETMKPLINTPGFVEALKDYVETQQYYPPDKQSHLYNLSDVNQLFGEGCCVFVDNWDDSFASGMEKTSSIFNAVGSLLSPGSRKVWNRKTNQWDDFPEVNYAPYIAWGWNSVVAKKSKNQKAAFDFLGFFANEANHKADILIGRFGVNPFRIGDLDKSFWMSYAGWNEQVVDQYIQTFKQQSENKNRVFDLRIHNVGLYMQSLSVGVARALMKRSTPQAALDEVAAQWEKITQEVGIDKQREAYRNVVQLEDNLLEF